ncbi:MAG: hypothetical protein LBS50_08215 [Prevotellaceae bacterium]|jgi:hypothetical protein|nr:hypothetical protein [Prevotellaceae bacterium]
MDTKLQRVDFLIRYLIYRGYVSYNNPQKDLAEVMKSHYVTVSRALSGDENYLTDKFIERLNDSFGQPFNTQWILTGEGTKSGNCQEIGNIKNSTIGDIVAGDKTIDTPFEVYDAKMTAKDERIEQICRYYGDLLTEKDKRIERITKNAYERSKHHEKLEEEFLLQLKFLQQENKEFKDALLSLIKKSTK